MVVSPYDDPLTVAEMALHELDGAADALDRATEAAPLACANLRDAVADLGYRLVARAAEMPRFP